MNCIRGGGGRGAVARGGRPRGAGGGIGGTATAAAAATATASQELSTSGKTPGASRAGTTYPVQGNASLRQWKISMHEHTYDHMTRVNLQQ